MDKHLELFDKELIIRSTANNNRILDLGGSTYKDFVYNTNSPYKFQSTEQQMILGCIYTRSRDDVVFEQGDISKMLEHSLEKWKEKNISSNSELGKDANDKNKWLMELNGNGRYIMLDPIRIREHSLKFPYYVSTERGGMAITQERRDAMEVYSFSDTDIERLKVRLEGLVENKYRQYPNWKSSELERAKGLINDFCNTEYQHGADFSDMTCVGIAHTTITDDEIPIQVNVNLIDYSLERYIDNTLVDKREFDDIADLAMNQLEYLNFDDLISFTDEELEKAGITPENKTAEATSVMDKTMFMIGRGKYDYHTTIIPSVEEQIAEYIVTNPDKDLTICDSNGNVLINAQKGVITSCADENYLNNTLQPALDYFREHKDEILQRRENIFQNVFGNNEAEEDEELDM